MGGRPFAPEPVPHGSHIAPQRGLRLWHVDAQSLVDGLMADTKPEDEAPTGDVGNKCRPLRTDIGVPQVNVGNPRGHRDPGRAVPISCAVAITSLFTSAAQMVSNPASSA